MTNPSRYTARVTAQTENASRQQDGGEPLQDILAVARRLFTTIGYQKTTVAEIAAELGKSPAHVYRFFDSKRAINEAVAELLLGQIGDELEVIAAGKSSPPERLAAFLLALSELSEQHFMTNSRVNDMVEDAMAESWGVCLRYIQRVEGMIRTIVEEGQSSGDFSVEDAAAGASCVKTTMVCFMHPTMMALSADHARPEIEQVIAYALRGLGAKPRR